MCAPVVVDATPQVICDDSANQLAGYVAMCGEPLHLRLVFQVEICLLCGEYSTGPRPVSQLCPSFSQRTEEPFGAVEDIRVGSDNMKVRVIDTAADFSTFRVGTMLESDGGPQVASTALT